MKKGNGAIITLLIVLIICVIAAIGIMLLSMFGVIGNTADGTASASEREETFETGESNPAADSGEIPVTGEPPETAQKDETTEKPAPETTVQHTHTYGSWQTLKEATCSEAGSEERVCACGEKETRKLDKLDHTEGEWTPVKKITCTEEGVSNQLCSVCGSVINVKTNPARGHSYQWVTTKAATCTSAGEKVEECKYSDCDSIRSRQSINKLGHSYRSTITENATCTKEGVQQYTCANCKDTYTEKIEKLGHKYSYRTISASCETPGGKEYECSRCSDTYFEKTSEAYGTHKLEVTGVCSRCNKDCSVDMTKRVGAPVENNEYGFSFYYDSTLNLSWEAQNLSNKEIKYCTLYLAGYNAVGDFVYGKSYKITGPIKSNKSICSPLLGFYDLLVFRNWLAEDQKITKITISHIMLEYMDGTVEAGAYGYSTTAEKSAVYYIYGYYDEKDRLMKESYLNY